LFINQINMGIIDVVFTAKSRQLIYR